MTLQCLLWLCRSHGRFRDALALAQQHLLPSDPLYVAVLDGAEAAYFSGSGPYETVAAQAPSAASDAASQATQQAAAAGSGSPATPTMQMLPPQLLAAQFLLAGER